jgi:soluble lytic murein transglycosylase-like protein
VARLLLGSARFVLSGKGALYTGKDFCRHYAFACGAASEGHSMLKFVFSHPSAFDRLPVRGSEAGAAICLVAGLATALLAHCPSASAKSPPAPPENPKRDIEAIEAAYASDGVLRLPSVVSVSEVLHNEQFDAIIKPVRFLSLSVEDAKRLKEAKEAADDKRFEEALGLRGAIQDPIAVKLVDWLVLRNGGGSISEYRQFLAGNPSWPNRWLLIQHLEEKLLKADDPAATLAAFKTVVPETAVGLAALAVALAKTGRKGEARKLARKAWREGEFPTNELKELAQRGLGNLIDSADIAWRKKAKKTNPDSSWPKIRSNAYDAMKSKKFKKAYDLAKHPKGLSVNPRNEQSFLLGWIALRYLGDPKTAKAHFSTMLKDADGPLTRSKSAYWLGRAYEALGDTAAAERHYRSAYADQIDTFHAHLARQRLKSGPQNIEINPPQTPSDEQIKRFVGLDAVKAVVIADKAGLGRSITRPFLANLGNIFESEAEVALAAHLSRSLGDTQQSVRIGKSGIARGMNLIYYAYPLHAFPDYKPLRKPPEPAFMLSVARQETEFDASIVSRAGARGILQVMPVTARHVCRDYKISCNIRRLVVDESYNTKISSAYIADRMEEFGGSYVLGLAGYNAGPGRARQWISQIGDPRDGRIDEVDWIERIPFKETREHVAKVLSNIQMYRARLGEKSPLRLQQDLERAKSHQRAEKRFAPGSKALRLSSGR